MPSDFRYIRRSRPIWLALSAATAAFLVERQSAGKWLYSADGRPRLTDFVVFWAAAKRLVSGNAHIIYDAPRQTAYEALLLQQHLERGLVFPYPPSSFLFIWPLACLPYVWAWLATLALGCGLWFAVLARITRDWVTALGMTFAFGAAAYCMQLGQNGFFTASLLCGALFALPRNKLLAGVLLGLLTFKPQLCAASIVALLVWREWRALQWSLITAAAMALLSAALFGFGIWEDFFLGDSAFTQHFSTNLDTIVAYLMQSVFAAIAPRLGILSAFVAQGAVATVALVCTARIRGDDQRAAGLIATTILITPFAFLYDLTMLVGAGAMLLRNAGNGREAALIILVTALPAIWFLTAGQVGVVSAAGLLALACVQSGSEPAHRGATRAEMN